MTKEKKTMTYDEIHAEVLLLKEALAEKTDEAAIHFVVKDYSWPAIGLFGKAGIIGKCGVEWFPSDDPAAAIAAARARIAELPIKENQATTTFRNVLASAISDALNGDVDPDLIAGARQSLKLASEALLPRP